MAKMKPRVQTGVVLFDVYFEDGTRASNRKVPAESLGGLDGDEPARAFIEEQEKKIAEMSGKPPRTIDRMVRSGR
ncbi:MAG: hypothetical protein J0H08_14110 [Rhizobiales bacterium]|nr:hypothetical protein [Hyphomicrobiales bacterium]